MAQSNPLILFGINQVLFYNRKTGVPLGIYRVIGSASIDATAENVKLFGGSSPFAWAVEQTNFNSGITISIREFSDMAAELAFGETAVKTSSSATGSIREAFANKNGSSVLDATTGIATALIKTDSEADLKSSKYLILAASETTVDVYMYNNVEQGLGTDVTIQDDFQKITASPLSITMGSAVEIPGTGIEITGGSGTIAMVVGDSADVATVSIHDGFSQIDIGTKNRSFGAFGMVLSGQKTNGDRNLIDVEAYNVVSSGGMSIPFGEKEFFESEQTFDALYDPVLDKVFTITKVNATN